MPSDEAKASVDVYFRLDDQTENKRRHCDSLADVTTPADRIQKILDSKGINASELNRRAKLPRGSVSQALRRYRQNPDAEVTGSTLQAIAEAGGVTVQWVLTGKGDPNNVEEPTPTTSTTELSSEPKWKNFPNFYAMAEAALADDARLKRWAVEVLAEESPMIAGHVDVAAIADLIRVVQRHVPPPPPPDVEAPKT